MQSLPFTISQWLGTARAVGLLRREGQSLLFEFELKDGLIGLLRTQVREVRIPFTDIETLQFSAGWRRDRLHLKTSTLRASQALPGHDCGQVAVTTSREDRSLAQQLVSSVQHELRKPAGETGL